MKDLAYINFKEENSKAKNQFHNRLKNNGKLFKKLRETKNISKDYMPDKEYSYKDFNVRIFGEHRIKGEENFEEVSNKDIICSTFQNCKFNNMKFKDCKFIGCYFINCDFGSGGVAFENCILFKEESDAIPSLNKNDNFSCIFKGCNIYGKFLNCLLNYAVFENCSIQNSNFNLTDMTSVIIKNSELNLTIIADTDLSGAKILNTYIQDLEFRDKYISKMDEKTFVDKIKLRSKTRSEYEGIYMVYETLANKFKGNQLNNNFGEYYYLAQKTKAKVLKPMPRIVSFLTWSTCGYGERPIYAVYSSIIIILIFSVLYLGFGIDINGQLVNYYTIFNNFNLAELKEYFNEAINLSVGMFAGVGFNTAQPTASSYMVTNVEMLVGVAMMGIGIGAVTRKIIR
ncbi:pentapeptide repeat-containing protein [Clostridium chauvoei]|uniref:pentapeptide repeat-containing protein n=1 Tax=Clostridium chauvoei TaxID=46867 RepID=UPI00288AD35C|nr:pentapeptide repeat-containing protein [Clostridium chauvoei]